MVSDDSVKAELFAEFYSRHPHQQSKFLEADIDAQLEAESRGCTVDISTDTILRALKKECGGIGPDGMHGAEVALLPPSGIRDFRALVSSCINTGRSPGYFLKELVIPTPKKGSLSRLKGWRPISITCVLARSVERVAKEIVRECFRTDGVKMYDPAQYGDSPERSSADAACFIAGEIESAIDKGNHCTGIAIDYSAAFDCAPTDKIGLGYLSAVRRIQDPSRRSIAAKVSLWIFRFLQGRTRVVSVNGSRSQAPVGLLQGTPQGTVCGPMCWCFYLNSLLTLLREAQENTPDSVRFRFIVYMDDITLLLSYPPEAAEAAGTFSQELLNKIGAWSESHNMRPNAEKSVYCTFQNRFSCAKPDFELFLYSGTTLPSKLEFQSEIKVLGVTFDYGLSFTTHCHKLCCKVRNRVNGIKTFASRTDADTASLKVFYKAFVESALVYAIPCFYEKIDQVTRAELESLQYQAAKVILGTRKNITREGAVAAAGLDTFDSVAKSESMAMLARGSARPVGDPLRESVDNQVYWARTGEQLKEQSAMADCYFLPGVIDSTFPLPALSDYIQSGHLDIDLKAVTPETLSNDVATFDELWHSDSSCKDFQTGVGLFGSISNGSSRWSKWTMAAFPHSSFADPFDGEKDGILCVVENIRIRARGRKVVIYTDSLSNLQSLLNSSRMRDVDEAYLYQSVLDFLMSGGTLAVRFCRGHCGWVSSDIADRLAKVGRGMKGNRDSGVIYQRARTEARRVLREEADEALEDKAFPTLSLNFRSPLELQADGSGVWNFFYRDETDATYGDNDTNLMGDSLLSDTSRRRVAFSVSGKGHVFSSQTLANGGSEHNVFTRTIESINGSDCYDEKGNFSPTLLHGTHGPCSSISFSRVSSNEVMALSPTDETESSWRLPGKESHTLQVFRDCTNFRPVRLKGLVCSRPEETVLHEFVLGSTFKRVDGSIERCPFCRNAPASTPHLISDCPVARPIAEEVELRRLCDVGEHPSRALILLRRLNTMIGDDRGFIKRYAPKEVWHYRS